MNAQFAVGLEDNDAKLLRRIAKDIAMDLKPIESILNESGVTVEWFESIQNTRLFQDFLTEETASWGSAPNTAERIRLKYLMITEEVAPNMFEALLDTKSPVAQRADLLKTVAKLAGLDRQGDSDAGSTGRIKITINMGAERPLQVEHQMSAPTIETDYTE